MRQGWRWVGGSDDKSPLPCFLKWADPGLFLLIFVLFKPRLYRQTVRFSKIRTRNVGRRARWPLDHSPNLNLIWDSNNSQSNALNTLSHCSLLSPRIKSNMRRYKNFAVKLQSLWHEPLANLNVVCQWRNWRNFAATVYCDQFWVSFYCLVRDWLKRFKFCDRGIHGKQNPLKLQGLPDGFPAFYLTDRHT